jgi:sulfate adenylyltransferase
MVYVQDKAQFVPVDEVEPGMQTLKISGTELRRRLREGLEVPEWFSYPEIIEELRKTHPPRHQQGFTVFFTGLSGSGKSTIANALFVKLLEGGGRRVTMLDGDLVRKHLSSELGFSREHRDINILRIGWVASEITRHGGVAICAPIAPYAATRRRVREMVERPAPSSRSSSPRRSKYASNATARVSMPRHAQGSSRSSPASAILTRSR